MFTHTIGWAKIGVFVLGFIVATAPARAAEKNGPAVEIRGGTATFDVGTNLPAISIHGKSTALAGSARIRETTDGLVIEELQAVLPVRTLNTGLGLRDEHMRKYVFTTSDGQVSDVRFTAERVVCQGTSDPRSCQISGTLSIRDTARPFTMTLKIDDKGDAFRAAGDGVVKLSAYGIQPPSQLGVTTMDDVKLHVDFLVKPSAERTARSAR
jgi:polyisoprenoid-binding protein YceI